MTKKEEFIDFLRIVADNNDEGFVGVVVKLPDQETPELIINLPDALHQKANYFQNAYDEDLKLHLNPEVRILKYDFTLDFGSLEYLMNELE